METPEDTDHCTEEICTLVGVRFLLERRDGLKQGKKKPGKTCNSLSMLKVGNVG